MRDLTNLLMDVLDPRKVLLAAVLVAALGIVASYIEVQDRADRELALRQGPPPAVPIQNFRPGADVGPAGEVRITGEIDIEAAAVVPVRGSDPARWQFLAPVFPVSDKGAALLAERAAPDDAVLAAQVERRVAGAGPRPEAIGLVTVPMPDATSRAPDLAGLAEAVIGEGSHGTLVTLNGRSFRPGDATLVAHGAFSVAGVTLAETFVTVEPFAMGRVAALSAPRPIPERRLLFIAALVLLAMAGALQLWKAFRGEGDLSGTASDDAADTPDFAARHPEFAPIPSQREIVEADRAAAERKAAEPHPATVVLKTVASGLWAMIWLAGAALGRGLRNLRNRRSRPEDEAL